MAISLEPEIEEEFRLILLRRDQSHHLLTKTFCDLLGFNVSNKTVLVRLTNKIACGGTGHGLQPAVA